VLVDWVHFGSNGYKTQPLSVVESFTKRARLTTNTPKYYSYKSIFQTDNFTEFGVHKNVIKGNTQTMSWSNPSATPQFHINHYSIQSEEYWRNVKMTRGDVNRWHSTQARNIEWFKEYDLNEEDDFTLRDQNKQNRITYLSKFVKLQNIKDDDVTVVITTCNRAFLLRETLASFLQFNTYPIKKYVIIEDSGAQGINDFCRELLYPCEVELIYNIQNIGQVSSIDLAYSKVNTKWIFHCEEDWKFYKHGFIERSFEILKKDPTVVTVWLRQQVGHCNILDNGHPVDKSVDMGGYYYMLKNFAGNWDGFTFNPGLRRTCDYLLVAPFEESCKPYHHVTRPGEYDVSRVYRGLGMRGAIPCEREGYVVHIGWNHHIPREWDGQ